VFRTITISDLKVYLGFMGLAQVILLVGLMLLTGVGLGFWPMFSQQTLINFKAAAASSFLVAFTPLLARLGQD
jgi:hypothetical protein